MFLARGVWTVDWASPRVSAESAAPQPLGGEGHVDSHRSQEERAGEKLSQVWKAGQQRQQQQLQKPLESAAPALRQVFCFPCAVSLTSRSGRLVPIRHGPGWESLACHVG